MSRSTISFPSFIHLASHPKHILKLQILVKTHCFHFTGRHSYIRFCTFGGCCSCCHCLGTSSERKILISIHSPLLLYELLMRCIIVKFSCLFLSFFFSFCSNFSLHQHMVLLQVTKLHFYSLFSVEISKEWIEEFLTSIASQS